MAQIEIKMPKMGESITEGTVIEWHKQPGDEVEQDETLLEIGTDKVDTEVPSPQAGILQEILVEEGETVDVDTPIAVLETEADEADESAVAPEPEPVEEEVQEEAEAEVQAPDAEPEHDETEQEPAETPAPSGGGERIEVVMPKMGESITEGTVIEWHKQPGDEVEQDETLLEIGTDKVDTEVPSPQAGILQEILVEEGETVEVGTVIAVLGTEAVSAPAAQQPEEPSGEDEVAEEEPAPETAPSGDGTVREPVPSGEGGEIERRGADGRFYSPLVRSIAEEEGLSMAELESIEGSGHEGRVTKEDVLGYLEEREAAPQPAEREAREAPKRAPSREPVKQPQTRRPEPRQGAGDYEGRVEIIEMDRMRQMIADHMIRSKQTSAHVTSFAEADVTNLVRLRERNKEAFLEREGVRLTYTPFFVKAAVDALREHPILNASVEDRRIIIKKDYHIGIAVAIGKTGLVVPVIQDAGQKNLVGLARTAAELAERARDKQLQPDDLQGGTFTVTNIGSLGSIMGTPIISQPQVGILATGAIKKRPVVVEDPNLGDIIAVRQMMYISLSYDHRIVDGAMSASFLQHFVSVLESYDSEAEL